MREQREVIYGQRYQIISAEEDLTPVLMSMMERLIHRNVADHTQLEETKDWNLEGIVDFAHACLLPENALSVEELTGKTREEIESLLMDKTKELYQEKITHLNGPEQLLEFQKVVILRVVDTKWTDHIDAMDQLRESIGLRAYGQNNPLVEYQQEGYEMFNAMVAMIDYDVTRLFMKAQIRQNVQREQVAQGDAVHPTEQSVTV